jgi:hypothetical protein
MIYPGDNMKFIVDVGFPDAIGPEAIEEAGLERYAAS